MRKHDFPDLKPNMVTGLSIAAPLQNCAQRIIGSLLKAVTVYSPITDYGFSEQINFNKLSLLCTYHASYPTNS